MAIVYLYGNTMTSVFPIFFASTVAGEEGVSSTVLGDGPEQRLSHLLAR